MQVWICNNQTSSSVVADRHGLVQVFHDSKLEINSILRDYTRHKEDAQLRYSTNTHRIESYIILHVKILCHNKDNNPTTPCRKPAWHKVQKWITSNSTSNFNSTLLFKATKANKTTVKNVEKVDDHLLQKSDNAVMITTIDGVDTLQFLLQFFKTDA